MIPSKSYPNLFHSVLLVLAVLAAQIGLGVAVSLPLVVLEIDPTKVLTAITGVVNLITFGGAVAWALWQRGESAREAFPRGRVRAAYLLPLAVMIAGMGIICSEVDNFTRYLLPMPEALAKLFEGMTEGGVAAVFALVIVAPLTEELLFRAVILRSLASRYSKTSAVLLSATLFSLMHVNPYQLFTALLAGIVLGWLYLRSGSVWLCILAHALFNLQVVLIPALPFEIPGYSTPGSGAVAFQPLWFDAAGLAAAGLGFLVLQLLLSADEPPPVPVVDAELVELPSERMPPLPDAAE